MRWFEKNFLTNYLYQEYVRYPVYVNLSYWWNFGVLSGICLVIQVITGIFLAMHYNTSGDGAFESVEHIMRDINFGWLLRYLHANGASFFFLCVYLHICRNLYYSSYIKPRELLWMIGMLIFLLMILTAFLGYVLPWGQMSFRAATVITNLATAIPTFGDIIVVWLWGGYSVDSATLNRFFSLHYLFPFILLALVILHVLVLHEKGSTNPMGLTMKRDKVIFHPYYTVKDLYGFILFLIVFVFFVMYIPNYLGHPDNYIMSNPLVTPAHIVPEWYFSPFYAILRSIPNKLGGVSLLLLSILVLFILPFIAAANIRNTNFRPVFRFIFWSFVVLSLFLGWLGGQPVEFPFLQLGQFLTFVYFMYFFFFVGVCNAIDWFSLRRDLLVVITSDKPPAFLYNLKVRFKSAFRFVYNLNSRFSGGLFHICLLLVFAKLLSLFTYSKINNFFFYLVFLLVGFIYSFFFFFFSVSVFSITHLIYILSIIICSLVYILIVILGAAFMTLFEREVLSVIQRRKGPNVIGFLGILQPFADAFKLLFKETIIPMKSNNILFVFSSFYILFLSLIVWAVIPFNYGAVLIDLNVGYLYVYSVLSLNIYGLILSGWSSNSRYSFLGALRACAQMLSYELIMGTVLLTVFLLAGSLNLSEIVISQKVWYGFWFFPLFILFFICALAETNRPPFDFPEAESELVSGYNVEYSPMTFAFFFLGEYSYILLMSNLSVILFFGGWMAPFSLLSFIPGWVWYSLKLWVMIYAFVWIRATLPRFRYDQLMSLGWKILLPLSFGYCIFLIGGVFFFGLLF